MYFKRFLFVFLALGFAACARKPAPSPVLATLNGEAITVAEFEKALARERWKFGGELSMSSQRLHAVKQQVMEELLKERLLLQEAKKRGVEVSPEALQKETALFKNHYSNAEDFKKFLEIRGMTSAEFEEEIRKKLRLQKLTEEVTLEKSPITDEDLQKYYNTHLSEFWHGEEVRARQMVTDSKEKAYALRGRLLNGDAFEALARQYSMSPDRKQGGDLGWFARGVMPPEFDQICFNLKPGELSEVIQTPYGYHLFEVLEVRGAGQLPFDAVKEDLRKKRVEEKAKEIFHQWYGPLRDAAKIEVDTAALEAIKE